MGIGGNSTASGSSSTNHSASQRHSGLCVTRDVFVTEVFIARRIAETKSPTSRSAIDVQPENLFATLAVLAALRIGRLALLAEVFHQRLHVFGVLLFLRQHFFQQALGGGVAITHVIDDFAV